MRLIKGSSFGKPDRICQRDIPVDRSDHNVEAHCCFYLLSDFTLPRLGNRLMIFNHVSPVGGVQESETYANMSAGRDTDMHIANREARTVDL